MEKSDARASQGEDAEYVCDDHDIVGNATFRGTISGVEAVSIGLEFETSEWMR